MLIPITYQHVRNKNVIYRRHGTTDMFHWGDQKRSHGNIQEEMNVNGKFDLIEIQDTSTGQVYTVTTKPTS